MSFDLIKKQVQEDKYTLKKVTAGTALETTDSMVTFVLDISGSMSSLFGNDTVQKVIQRLFPIAAEFDDDGSMEVYVFGRAGDEKQVKAVTLNNLENYVKNENIRPTSSGTDYAPVLNMILQDYLQKTNQEVGGFTGGTLFGKLGSFFKGGKTTSGKTKITGEALPMYVNFITDGNNFDEEATREVIRNLSQVGIFISFVGLGEGPFTFLEEVDKLSGTARDCVSYFQVTPQNALSMPSEEFYRKMLSEYPKYVKKAKADKIIA